MLLYFSWVVALWYKTNHLSEKEALLAKGLILSLIFNGWVNATLINVIGNFYVLFIVILFASSLETITKDQEVIHENSTHSL